MLRESSTSNAYTSDTASLSNPSCRRMLILSIACRQIMPCRRADANRVTVRP